MSAPRIGVLGLQGDFARHRDALESAGAAVRLVTRPGDLAGLQALVMPGGESTTMQRVMMANGLREPLAAFVRATPTLGTCAGLILLSTDATRLPYPPLGILDLDVERNAYGTQRESFTAEIEAPVLGGLFQGVFIRAPRIRRVGAGIEVIARRGPEHGAPGEPVGVRRGPTVGLCFHPELTGDPRFHRWFLEEVAGLTLPEGGPRGAFASRGAA